MNVHYSCSWLCTVCIGLEANKFLSRKSNRRLYTTGEGLFFFTGKCELGLCVLKLTKQSHLSVECCVNSGKGEYEFPLQVLTSPFNRDAPTRVTFSY